jgi:hypothetical protein
MFLAIITKVFEREMVDGKPNVVQAMPIATNELDKEILARCRFPLVATRGEMKARLRDALREIETDAKNQTIFLSTKNG